MKNSSDENVKHPVNTLFEINELKLLDALVERDMSSRAAIIRKAVKILHIVTIEKPELYQKIFY